MRKAPMHLLEIHCRNRLAGLLLLALLGWSVQGIFAQREQAPEAAPPPARQWMEQADSLFQQEQYGLAITRLEQALQWFGMQRQWPRYTQCLNSLATNYYFNGQREEALSYNARAILSARNHLPARDTLLGDAFYRRAEILLETGVLDSSIHYYQLAEPIFRQANQGEDLAFCYIGQAVGYYYSSAYESQETSLDSALATARRFQLEDKTSFAIIFQLYGVLYDVLGDYDKALDISHQAVEVFRSSSGLSEQDSLFLSGAYNNIGGFYYSKGDYGQAVEYYQRAIRMKEEVDDDALSKFTTYNNLALAFALQGNQEGAIRMLETSKKLLEGNSGPEVAKRLVVNYNAIARNYLLDEEPDKALPYLQQALRLSAPGQPEHYAVFRNFGQAYLQQGQYGKALEMMQRSLSEFQSTFGKAHPGMSERYRMVGETLWKSGRYEEALEQAQQALAVLAPGLPAGAPYPNPSPGSAGNRLEMLRALELKAAVLYEYYEHQSGNEKGLLLAMNTYQLLGALTDSLRREFLALDSKQQLSRNTKKIYENAIATALRLHQLEGKEQYLEQAFEFAERNKAILMQERLQDSEAKLFTAIPDSLRNQEKQIKRDLAFYQKQLFEEQRSEEPDSLKMALWQNKAFDLSRALEKLIGTLEQQYPNYYSLKYQIPASRLADIQEKLLAEEGLLIEFFVGDSSLFVFCVSPRGILARELERPPGFKETVLQFRGQLARPPAGTPMEAYQAYCEPAFALYQFLLAPVLKEHPGAKQLFIIADDVLNFIPFEALLATEASYESPNYNRLDFLLNRYRINYSPSAGLLLNQQKNRSRLPGAIRCLVFAPSYGDGQYTEAGPVEQLRSGPGALPGAQQEARALSNYFSGDFFFGSAATEQAFKKNAPGYGLIHLAMHGTADHEHPLYSKLIFGETPDTVEDNLLHTYELYNLQLNARLAVLSACETGFGKFIQGEGVLSLASGFLHTGCPSVTMSLWEAQDAATARIMEYYYQNLAEGQPKDGALQAAKLAYIKAPASQKHPFYWAAFVNIGDNSPLIQPSRWSWGWAGALALGLVFLAGVWMRRRSSRRP